MKKSDSSKKIQLIKNIALSFSVILMITGCQSTSETSRLPASSRWVSSEGSTIVSLMPSTQTWPYVSSQPVTESDVPVSSSMTASELKVLEDIRLIFFQRKSFGKSVCAFYNETPLKAGMYYDKLIADKIHYTTPQLYLYNIEYPYTQFPAKPSASIAYTAGHQDGYQLLLDTYAAAGYEYGNLGWIAFTDADYPFNFAITHHAYTIDAQPGRSDWKEAFIPLYSAISTPAGDFDLSDTPVIITDVWRFDLDGDGVTEELVRASNIADIPETAQILKPVSENTGAYNIMILFSETLGTTVVCEEKVYIQKLQGNDYSFVYEDKAATVPVKTTQGVYQYDKNGNLIICPYYLLGEGYKFVLPVPIVCDADNDGKPELIIVRHSNPYWTVRVYKAGLEDGLLLCENAIDP